MNNFKTKEEPRSSVFHCIWLYFYFKMSHNIYISHIFSDDYTRISGISASRWHESPVALCHPLPSASGDITRPLPSARAFVSSRGLIFWYVSLESMWYMYNVDLSFIYVDSSDHYVDLSENYVDMSDIILTSRWQIGAKQVTVFSY